MCICVECGCDKNVIKHHIIPKSRGGVFTIFLCQACHDKCHEIKPRNISLSQLTKDGLKRAKNKGVRLGNPNFKYALKKAVSVRVNKAKINNDRLKQIVTFIINTDGLSKLKDVCERMNGAGYRTIYGNKFTPTHIHRLLK